jgi:polysaccharide biosynthesis protein PslG
VRLTRYESATGHNIADVFWTFMNSSGPIKVNGQYVNGEAVDWIYSIGLPITEPYWTRVKVGGVEKDVLIQIFERRALTYTPSNSAAFQVEMGNIGRHYAIWRYGSYT